ncbi:MAG TPA: sigma-70 family RNA polymerase sigma factor [Puia sp.]
MSSIVNDAVPLPTRPKIHNMNDFDINDFRNGDLRTWRSLLEWASAILFHMSYGIVKDRHVAEDMIQDGMGKIWERRYLCQNVSHVKGYLYNTVRNSSLEYLRRNKNTQFIDPQDSGYLSIEGKVLSKLESLAIELTRRKLLKAIDAGISNLTPQQQKIIRLRRIDNLTTAEVAKILGIGEQAVRNRDSEARKILEELLTDQGHSPLLTILWPLITLFLKFFSFSR